MAGDLVAVADHAADEAGPGCCCVIDCAFA